MVWPRSPRFLVGRSSAHERGTGNPPSHGVRGRCLPRVTEQNRVESDRAPSQGKQFTRPPGARAPGPTAVGATGHRGAWLTGRRQPPTTPLLHPRRWPVGLLVSPNRSLATGPASRPGGRFEQQRQATVCPRPHAASQRTAGLPPRPTECLPQLSSSQLSLADCVVRLWWWLRRVCCGGRASAAPTTAAAAHRLPGGSSPPAPPHHRAHTAG